MQTSSTENFEEKIIMQLTRKIQLVKGYVVGGPKRDNNESKMADGRHLGFGFSAMTISNKDVCIKFGTRVDIAIKGYYGGQKYTNILAKSKAAATWIKFGTPMHNDMPMMIRRSKSKSELKLQHGGCLFSKPV